MRAIVNRGIFKAVASTVCAAIPKMEMSSAKLEADGDQIVISATGEGMFARASVPAKIERPGAIAVDLRHLTKFIARSAHPTFTIEVRNVGARIKARIEALRRMTEERGCTPAETQAAQAAILRIFARDDIREPRLDKPEAVLRIGRAKWKMPVTDAAIYPEQNCPRVRAYHQIDPATFAKLAAQVLPTVKDSHYDRALLGIENGAIKMVATTGYELIEVFSAEPELRCEPTSFTLPEAALVGFTKIAKRAAAAKLPFALGFEDGHAVVRVGEDVCWCHLSDVSFPEYRTVLPTGHEAEVTVDQPALVSTLGRVIALLAKEKSTKKAFIGVVNGKLIVKVGYADPTDAFVYEEIDATIAGTPPKTLQYNLESVLRCVEGLEVEEVKLGFNSGDSSPIEIFSKSEPGYRAITSPMSAA